MLVLTFRKVGILEGVKTSRDVVAIYSDPEAARQYAGQKYLVMLSVAQHGFDLKSLYPPPPPLYSELHPYELPPEYSSKAVLAQ